MTQDIQDTLFQLFERVRHQPEILPPVLLDGWQEGSAEWRLLESFRGMVEQVRQRMARLEEVEEQLREREEQHHSIFEAVTDAILIVELKESRVVEVNRRACELYGYTRKEFLGRVVGMSDDTRYPPVYGRDVIKAGGLFQIRDMTTGKDGKSFHSEIHAFPFTYKSEPHMLVIVRDINEQVQASEREEQYRSIFEASTDGILIIELEESRVVEVNPKACQLSGYSRDEFLGRIVGLNDDTQRPPIYARDVVRSGGIFQKRGIATGNDGKTFHAEYIASPFIYKGKTHMLQIVHDLTAQVQTEQQLRAHEKQHHHSSETVTEGLPTIGLEENRLVEVPAPPSFYEDRPPVLQIAHDTAEQVQPQQSLYEGEEQYRSIFEAVIDGLLIIDPKTDRVVEVNPSGCQMFGYTREEFLGRVIIPNDDSQEPPVYARDVVRAGGLFQMRKRLVGKEEKTFDAEVRASPFAYKGLPHMLVVVRDITAQLQAEQQLREREEQYRSIFEAVTDGILIVDLQEKRLIEVNPRGCQMFGYTREEFLGRVIALMDNTQHPPVYARDVVRAGGIFQTRDIGRSKDGKTFYIEAHASPFTYKGKPHMLAILRDITEQVQAQQLLEQRVEERTRELASLLEISHTVASTLQLKPLLGLILDQLKTVVDYTGASILTVEGDELVILDSRSPTPQEQLMQLRLSLQRLGPIWETINSGESILLPDVRAESPLTQPLHEAMRELMDTTFRTMRACLFVPLTLKNRVIGMLVLTSSETETFTSRHATLALAIANQAAIAIENARLYAQAQELAALEERQKLARELHDSVSQALYGISLGAHTARKALDRHPGEVAEPLDYVLSLAEAGLAEMRALIFELRPESLETEGLVAALTKQAAAIQARHEIAVALELCDEPVLSLPVKQHLYRIAQEAMHNTVKHAHASTVHLRLSRTRDGIMLEVRDNGVGFDPSASYPGHLGLHSMRERSTDLGGTFQIESTTGQGTTIRAHVPAGASQ